MGRDPLATSPSARAPAIRFHGFRIPQRVGLRGSMISLAIVAVVAGISLGWLLVLNRGNDFLGIDWTVIRYPVSLLFGVIVGGGFALWFGRQRRRNTPPGRMGRLRRLCRHRGAAITRFPHRMVEIRLRKGGTVHRVVQRAAGWKPGMVLLINSPLPPVEVPEGMSGKRRFEPIGLDDPEGMTNLIASVLDATVDASTGPVDDAPARPAVRGSSSAARAWFGWTVGWGSQILIIGYALYMATRGGQPFCLIYLAAAALLPILARQFTRDQWWLIPGGLVLERYRFWRRRSTLHRFAAPTSVLVIRHGRADEHQVMVSDGERTHRVTQLDRGLPILLAWLSTAPPPTDEQLLDFFAGGGEMPELLERTT